MDTKDFFQSVFRNGTGKAVIVLANYAGKPTRDFWFEYPAQIDSMVTLVNNNQTSDVWYSPILYTEESRTKATALTTSVLAADADACDPNNFRVKPSLSVQTSDGHWQVYWYLREDANPHDTAKVNRRISQVHKAEGCDQAYVNAAKLMRVPGTSNSKHPGAVVIATDWDDYDEAFNIVDFEKVYTPEEVPDAVDTATVDMPDDVPAFIDANRQKLLAGLPNSMGLRELMFGSYQADKRSDVRYKLLCELYRLGLDDYGVMALAWDAPSNKYNGDDPRSYKGLWDEAMRAKQDTLAEMDAYDLPVDSNGTVLESGDSGTPKKSRTNFLTEDEEEVVRGQINFIDEWINWAGTKTDAPAEYHRAAAITILSTVYSEFGHATPKFAPKGGLKLNIWMMVLGRSTKDRKSTARRYMNDMFRALKTDDDYAYSLGDDVTPSGISLALHDRANKASVFDRDEVQGLFKELLHQSYMSGGVEVFTKLYDGWSGGRLRSTGDKKQLESVPVSFIMFMMGILTEATEVLTVTNYRSGFLTRFIYVIGRRPDGFKAPPMEQATEGEDEKDPVFDGLVNHMALNRNFWEMRGGDGNTYGMRADDDAWARLQEFEAQVTELAEASQYAEVISSTSDRMVISTLKLAALLAMDDRALSIKLPHVLQAIAYAGEWFDNAVEVASMVSESEWQRDVDRLEAFINSKGGETSYAMAYRQFGGMKPKDFDNLIDALIGRGVLNRIQQGSRWILKIDYSE